MNFSEQSLVLAKKIELAKLIKDPEDFLDEYTDSLRLHIDVCAERLKMLEPTRTSAIDTRVLLLARQIATFKQQVRKHFLVEYAPRELLSMQHYLGEHINSSERKPFEGRVQLLKSMILNWTKCEFNEETMELTFKKLIV